MNRNKPRHFCIVLLLGLTGATLAGPGQAQMCKWTDEDGTVHYAERCPEGVEADSVKVRDDAPAQADDPYGARAGSKDKTTKGSATASASADGKAGKSAGRKNKSPTQLRADCERAREARLKPERQRLVKACIDKGDRDAGYCRRYYANHGDGGRQGGRVVPRKYDNLPECVAARQAGGQK